MKRIKYEVRKMIHEIRSNAVPVTGAFFALWITGCGGQQIAQPLSGQIGFGRGGSQPNVKTAVVHKPSGVAADTAFTITVMPGTKVLQFYPIDTESGFGQTTFVVKSPSNQPGSLSLTLTSTTVKLDGGTELPATSLDGNGMGAPAQIVNAIVREPQVPATRHGDDPAESTGPIEAVFNPAPGSWTVRLTSPAGTPAVTLAVTSITDGLTGDEQPRAAELEALRAAGVSEQITRNHLCSWWVRATLEWCCRRVVSLVADLFIWLLRHTGLSWVVDRIGEDTIRNLFNQAANKGCPWLVTALCARI